jgi:phytoene dehydrogenase-like protein
MRRLGFEMQLEEFVRMNGFQVLDVLFESEYIKTMLASLSWIGAFPPIHRMVGTAGCALLSVLTGPIFPVHQVKGGSHMLTHSLVKCATSHGAKILTSCPVEKIMVKNSESYGVILSKDAIYPEEKISAKKVVSDITVVPTFIELVGEENLDPETATKIKRFYYDEQVLFGVHYALKEPPIWTSSDFDVGIQRCFMGYFGGETQEEMEGLAISLLNGRIHEKVIANWFVPTLADPSQAPPDHHTAFVWFDVPPSPLRWGQRKLKGFEEWDNIKDELADAVTDTFEKYAPGFKRNVLDRIVYTPLDISRNNPSAVRGNWVGGSMVPDQFFTSRPLPGVIVKGGSRTFIKNLYLSNSIHPMGASWLASGYITACEVAEDLGIRDKPWWSSKAVNWYIDNLGRIPKNLGVPEKWKK